VNCVSIHSPSFEAWIANKAIFPQSTSRKGFCSARVKHRQVRQRKRLKFGPQLKKAAGIGAPRPVRKIDCLSTALPAPADCRIPEVLARVKSLLPCQNLKHYQCGRMATKPASFTKQLNLQGMLFGPHRRAARIAGCRLNPYPRGRALGYHGAGYRLWLSRGGHTQLRNADRWEHCYVS
jgi:hypothetical protein